MTTVHQIKDILIERFWSKIKFGEPNECWEWQAYKDTRGYGYFSIRRSKSLVAHKYMYIKIFGDVGGLKVCHSCDNPSCVNPNHLWLGTQGQNLEDMRNKGRHSNPPKHIGEDNNKAKLTDRQVRLIKMMLSLGERGINLSNVFGVTPGMIGHIKCGRSWTHI